MNRMMTLLAGSLATLSVAGLAFAQSPAPATTEAPKDASAPAPKPIDKKARATRQMMGQVVSVDQQSKTLTVKRRRGRQLTFSVEPDAANLGELKAGDQVRIRFVRADGHLTAKQILKSEAAAGK